VQILSKALDEKLRRLEETLSLILYRLDVLENLIDKKSEYAHLSEVVSLLKTGTKAYSEPIKIVSRLVAVERYLRESAIFRDDISRLIVQALAVKGPMNISQITEDLRARRGKASRRIVRKRLKTLLSKGTVKKVEGRGNVFKLVEK
jgi:hypothetical protein